MAICGSGGNACLCRGGCAGDFPSNDSQLAARLYGAAFGGQNLTQNTSSRSRHFDTHLIGFQFTEHFVLSHRIAGCFIPCGDCGFADRFAQDRHHYRDGLRSGSGGAFGGRGGRGRGGRGCGPLVDLCQQRFGIDGCAFGSDDFGQSASYGAGHFNCDLISLQLAEHVIHSNLIAGFFEPRRDSGLGHRFAQGGNTNFGGHDFILST